MGLPSAIPSNCSASLEAALAHRRYAGWFSYVLFHRQRATGLFCVRGYSAFEWGFAALLLLMSVLALATCVCVAFIFLRRRVKRCLRGDHVGDARRLKDAPAITAIIPCYLPNEQLIIEETIEWVMHRVESPGRLEVLVVYNTPHDLPEIEAKLHELEAFAAWPGGRRLRILRVRESRSKAANLNAALRCVTDPYVVIYDADHHPDRESLLLLWEKMSRRAVDCVQGSYYMRNLSQNQFGCSPCAFPFLARIVDAEFFTDWFLMKLSTRTCFLGNGYFSGSNALWKRDVLSSRQFSETAQTEDIDMAIQQLLDGRRIEFCAESRSGELAPMTCASMWKQRLRWTIGWDEATLKHGGAFADSGRLDCRSRCGLCWTFVVRWVMTVLTVGTVYVGFPMTTYWPLDDAHWGRLIAYLGRCVFIMGCGPWLLATIEALIQIPNRGRQGAIQAFFVFLVSSPFGFAAFFFYGFLLQLTSCFKLSTGRVKGWEVTQRAPSTTGTARKVVESPSRSASDLEQGVESTVSSSSGEEATVCQERQEGAGVDAR